MALDRADLVDVLLREFGQGLDRGSFLPVPLGEGVPCAWRILVLLLQQSARLATLLRASATYFPEVLYLTVPL